MGIKDYHGELKTEHNAIITVLKSIPSAKFRIKCPMHRVRLYYNVKLNFIVDFEIAI